MPNFKLWSEHQVTGDITYFNYCTTEHSLKDVFGNYMVKPIEEEKLKHAKYGNTYNWNGAENPATKSRDIRRLKISMGLSCNYSCSYCSQRFVPNADETSQKYVPKFLELMPTWFNGGSDGKGKGVKIEFWGGEPFVYWKTMKPLVEGIYKMYPNADLYTITNGSLLDDEKIDFLIKYNFAVSVSHDALGYHVRGLDPLDNPKQEKYLRKLFNTLAPKGKMSFNPMIHKENMSRAKVQKWFEERFDNRYLYLGEGSFIDAYDEGGLENSLQKKEDHLKFRKIAIKDIVEGKINRFLWWQEKFKRFTNSLEREGDIEKINQKCGMDSPHFLAVDLRGNVTTCQNVSAVAKAPNGEMHHSGNVRSYDNVKVRTIKSWQNRPNCKKCPVLALCKGSCTFLDGELFDASCENAFSDNVIALAGIIHNYTADENNNGYIPFYIEGNHREDRKDIFDLGITKEDLKLSNPFVLNHAQKKYAKFNN